MVGLTVVEKTVTFVEKLEEIAQKYSELTTRLSEPAILANPSEQIRIAKERAEYEEMVELYTRYKSLSKALAEADEMRKDEAADAEMKTLADEEWSALNAQKSAVESTLRGLLNPGSPYDNRDLFLEIRAGTGGDEAALFVSDLLRMYTKYAERKGWKIETMTSSETGIGGLKEIILSVSGKGAFRHLQYESGVHRVQRVPKTEASGRIHTSTVTVAAIPEAEEVDITVEQKDLRIDTYCASGPGGQGVNTTYSAVRITHLPSGLVVTCQDERSQIKNKAKALRVLRSRLLEAERERHDAEMAENRRSKVGTGGRSEKIRTYNFKENRITDHRLNLSFYQLDRILEGEIDELIQGLIAQGDIQ